MSDSNEAEIMPNHLGSDRSIDTSNLRPEGPRRNGHKHTSESKRKIGIANRGNVPWNKGRHHSEETKRRIAEGTKKAMLRPEMRRLLQKRARGRRHSEATKLKIRETTRISRGAGAIKRKPKKLPVKFVFEPRIINELNASVKQEIEANFEREDAQKKFVVREKKPMPPETRAKLSQRIKDLWKDPAYRMKVQSGVVERQKQLKAKQIEEDTKAESLSSISEAKNHTKRRARSARVKIAEETVEEEEEEVEDDSVIDDRDAEIVLGSDVLRGWTKEDLGIFGEHAAGPVDTAATLEPPVFNDISDPTLYLSGDSYVRKSEDVPIGKLEHLGEEPQSPTFAHDDFFDTLDTAQPIESPPQEALDEFSNREIFHGGDIPDSATESDRGTKGHLLDFSRLGISPDSPLASIQDRDLGLPEEAGLPFFEFAAARSDVGTVEEAPFSPIRETQDFEENEY